MNDEKLKGIAKSVAITFYNGGVDNKPKWTSFQYYNDKGKITSYAQYNKFGILEDNDTYFYDIKGHLIKVRYEEYGKLKSISIIKYDNSGSLLEVLSLTGDSIKTHRTTYKKSPDGKLIEKSCVNTTADTLVYKTVDELDANGNTLVTKVYNKENNLVRIWRSQYDQMNNTTIYEEFDANDKLISKVTYDYSYYPDKTIKTDIIYTNGVITGKDFFDVYGNSTKAIAYSGDKSNDITSKDVYKYEYDPKGNWTKKVEYENGEVSTSEVRKIEY